jgi:tetratricopeptide (TPR) repeat protein
MMESDYNIRKAYQYKADGNDLQYLFFRKAKQPFYNIDPNGTPIDWYLAYQYANSGNNSMAEQLLKSSLQAHPYHKQSLNDLGTIYYHTKGKKAAETFYLKAHRIAPDFVDANVNLSILKINSRQYDSAWYYLSLCDTVNYHSFYRAAIIEAGKNIGLNLINRITSSDSLLSMAVEGIIDNPEWIWLSHKHALENNRNLMQQFLEEAVYVLLKMNHTIDLKTANQLRNKYIN